MSTPNGDEPALPRDSGLSGNEVMLGGDRAIVMCETHHVAMFRDLFGQNICPDCLRDSQRIGRYGGAHLRERKPSDPEWFYVGKNTPVDQITCVRAGLHPMGFPLLDNPLARCGNCTHLVKKQYGNTYYKCELIKDSGGYATDIRRQWTACTHWQAMEGE